MSSKPKTKTRGEAEPRSDAIRLVLVVDDSRLQRKILSASLVRWGFDVIEAASGEEALTVCADHQPDLILSDWMMPGISGLEFCRAFRELSGDNFAYFILLTSKSEKAEVALGLDSGADDFLSKPVDPNELRARINAGERILRMHRELIGKNRLITDTLDELQRVYDSLDKDLIEAKKLQQSLLRDRHKIFETGALSLVLQSSGHVGGDLVGFFPCGENQLGLFAIDVSGHGISSALMTARLAGYLSATSPEQNVALQVDAYGGFAMRPPRETIELLNQLVLCEMDTEHYFTLLLACVDLTSGEVTISQAGHPHPLIQRKDGTIEQNGTGGFPVGLVEDVKYEQFTITLGSGDRLLILSDGTTECPDPNGAMLGEEGLDRMMTKLKNVQGPRLLEALMWELTHFAGDADFPDDVSGILFEYDVQ
jgi:sigma-B regulation protein RsbU (phosphoserine phosphatase)